VTVLEILADPERARAFADLSANPHGSVRLWADRWGWTLPRVHRFLKALEKAGLARFERSQAGTVLRPIDEVLPVTPAVTPPVTPCHLDPRPLDHSREQKTVTPNYTEKLIEAMNGELSRIYGSDHRAIRPDQKGSHRAGDAMQAAGIPLDFALERLLADCRTFNPSKHGRGKLPQSLNLFTRGILRAWTRRSQLELGLPPKLKVDRAPDPPAEARGGKPAPIGEAIGSWKDAFAAGQKNRARE
jgi:hypothetical protein